ncbi:MAG TPA: AAA family ATPase [Patescibacteria group bacterium]
MNKLVCVTGLCGSGKSVVSDYLVDEEKFQFLRFGQITLDEVKKQGLELNEANERAIRERLRKEHGMAAFAILNLPKLDELIKKGNVVGDGLYSFEEYKVLKEHFGAAMSVIAVYAPPELRYKRISERVMPKDDINLRHRSLTKEDAKARDFAEIENLNKGGTIAMADYTLVNTKDLDYLLNQLNEAIIDIKRK